MKLLLLLLLSFVVSVQAAPEKWEGRYRELLGKYSTSKGVRYADWKANPADLQALGEITATIAKTDPSKLTKPEQLAFYINAYNAWTLHNVLAAYPIKSIRDVYPIFGFFTRKTITVAGEKMSLNHLEKDIIIAKFREPRIHAAVNCASRSCPVLANESYTAQKLDKQLDAAFSLFVNQNPLGVAWDKKKNSAAISSIFKWYADDFKPAGGAVPFINQFRKDKLPADVKVTYQDYDWTLNDAR
ncbi:MAG TPA: DUF547 domain-containing protein [Chthoniobacterales bacterium]|jgi:hypothetical protein